MEKAKDKVTPKMVVAQLMMIIKADRGALNGRLQLFRRVRNLRLPERALACSKAAKIHGDTELMEVANRRYRQLRVSKI